MVAGDIAIAWLGPWIAAAIAVAYARDHGTRVTNYRGVPVPRGLGVAWFAWAVLGAAAWLGVRVLVPGAADTPLSTAGLLVAGVALLGWLDDRLGSTTARGFAGHLRAVGRGRVTTGLVKMLGIGVLALWASWAMLWLRPESGVQRTAVWVLAAAVIALTANLVNLLDLRPGRALKAYLVIAVAALAPEIVRDTVAGDLEGAMLPLIVFLGPAVVCLPADLGERAMLGDMGANAAGALAGWLLARALPLPGLAVAAALLLALNLASERVSFSAVIEGNAALRWLDGLGRRAVRQETGS
jgi:UDP-GlcNAc:undecaprenyl-phosphate/decaprenyl-phosphate GlcNAc-1-phosphate transferase